MWSLIIPIISQLLGEKGPLGQYFKIRSDTIAAEQTYRLETLKAQTEQAKADVQQVKDRLDATSQDFKQLTFWFLCVPVIVTILPFTKGFAVEMWNNFTLIPEWFQILFVSVYSSIWGLPIAKEYLGGMFRSLGNAVEARRDYKLQKYNDKIFFDIIREGVFKNGMTQDQVDVFQKALDAHRQG